MSTAQVTFVVPVRDRPLGLDRLLTSIGDGTQTIVVDDCSVDPDAIAKIATAHGADLIALSVNVGPAAARNEGLRRVATPFVAFVDSDVVLEPDALPTLLRHFGDPKVAIAGPRILGLPAAGRTTWISRYEEARSSLDLGPESSTVRPRSPVAWMPSACLVARVHALEDGFSADMRVGEDVDLVWRLADRGWRIRYEPAARVRHEHRATIGSWLARKVFYGTGAHLLAQRHGYDVAPAILSPWSAAVVIALLAQRRWSLPAAAGVSTAAAVRIATRLNRSTHPVLLSASLTAQGVVVALWQMAALLLRHWWPLTAVGCLFSTRLRRALALAGAVDTTVEYLRASVRLDPFRFAIARRLDDLAYGSGVWYGAIKGRSLRALLPDFRRSRSLRCRRNSCTHVPSIDTSSTRSSSSSNAS